MSENNKKTNEERQKEVDRQLELMKAAIGDDDFSDSDSETDNDMEELKERNNKNAAMESARKFLWDEAEDDDQVMLGGPFPTNRVKPPPTAASAASTDQTAPPSTARGSSSGMFGASIFGRNSNMSDDLDHTINLMDASDARGASRPSGGANSSKTRPSLSNLFLRGSPSMAASWNDAGARDSEEFIMEGNHKRPSYVTCMGWFGMWALTGALFGIFGFYVYDFVNLLKHTAGTSSTAPSTPIEPTTPFIPADASQIQQVLMEQGVLSGLQLQDANSPQNAALAWITADGTTPANDEYLAQRYSLAVLYYSTNGGLWANSQGWLSSDGYCQWYGIQCLGTEALIEQANHNGPVFEINLASNNLKGSVPQELSNFKDLFFLDLQDNQLEGTLPNALGGWNSMRMFSIAHNQLYGSIPSSLITTTPDLHIFNAGHNKFSGSLPSELGTATGLREVRLEFNDLDGTIPASFQDLDRLETLHLAGNKIQGSIPHALYDMARLETLYLHGNALTGTLSTEFGRLSHLELLTLNHNELVGSIPDVFSKNRFLQEMRLHGNELTGTMPSSVCALTSNKLTYLSATCTKTDAANEIGVKCDCCTDCL